MKKQTTVFTSLVFFSFLVLCAVIAWCGGYNFDTRDANVAVGVVGSIIISAVCTGFIVTVFTE